MPRPLIGLNMAVGPTDCPRIPKFSINGDYIEAIEAAGGKAVLVPPTENSEILDSMLEGINGFLFIGGPDYHPKHYKGRSQRQEQLLDSRRDRFDIRLGRKVLLESDMPVLGICGGHQLISLSYGGRLIQDLKTEWPGHRAQGPIPHAKTERAGRMIHGFRHPVRVDRDSTLAGIVGSKTSGTLETNSYHHQAVDPGNMGKGWRAVAWAEDGVVEAMEPDADSEAGLRERFLLGVQWHPERLTAKAAHLALFKALVNAAGEAGGV